MKPTVLLFITDGRREYAEQTLESLRSSKDPTVFSHAVAVDDSCDPAYHAWLENQWPWTIHTPIQRHKRGFDGAIRAGWEAIASLGAGIDYVYHLEDDFVLLKHLPLPSMQWILATQPHVAQVALKRQPWNETEAAAGGIPQVNPEAWTDRAAPDVEGCGGPGWPAWCEQRLFFTTNPSLYRRSLIDRGWPTGEHSEGRFSVDLFEQDPTTVCAFMGRTTDPPWVHHIGGANFVSHRTGTNY